VVFVLPPLCPPGPPIAPQPVYLLEWSTASPPLQLPAYLFNRDRLSSLSLDSASVMASPRPLHLPCYLLGRASSCWVSCFSCRAGKSWGGGPRPGTGPRTEPGKPAPRTIVVADVRSPLYRRVLRTILFLRLLAFLIRSSSTGFSLPKLLLPHVAPCNPPVSRSLDRTVTSSAGTTSPHLDPCRFLSPLMAPWPPRHPFLFPFPALPTRPAGGVTPQVFAVGRPQRLGLACAIFSLPA